MRRIFLVCLVAICSQLNLQAQNELEVSVIRSPQFDFNYEEDDSVDVEITMVNRGPNIIERTDFIYFDVTVANPDTSIFYTDIRRLPLRDVAVNGAEIFTLITDLKFNSQDNYQICVNVKGTDRYPTNISKKVGPCVSFVVGVQEEMIAASKVYFSNNKILFQLNKNLPSTVYRILDISGKVLNSGTLNRNYEQELNFDAPAKGLYFLQLQAIDGQQATYKFIIH